MIRTRPCQQCLTALIHKTASLKGTVSRSGLEFISKSTPSSRPHLVATAPFSTSSSDRAAFLRAGPGRELSSSTKKKTSLDPQGSQGESTQSLAAFTNAFNSSTSISTSVSPQNSVSPSAKADPIFSDHFEATIATAEERKPPQSSSSNKTPYKEIVLLETDFRERFIKGGGNGGQKINKTNSNVELKHYETGIVVQCQATRSLPQNRKLARRILIERLDEYYNGEMSKRGQKAEKIRERKKRMARKSAKKYHGSGADTGVEDVDAEKDGDIDDELGESDENEDAMVDTKRKDSNLVPEATILSTTLEQILAGENKKLSRRKSKTQGLK